MNLRWPVLAAVLLTPALGQPAEFAPDEHTLLLAHFDDSPAQADYAMGWDRFSSTGAHLTEGYWGRALDTRGLQKNRDPLTTCDQRLPHFMSWGFWPRGNVNWYQGTFELWFKVSPTDIPQGYARNSIFFTNYFQPVPGSGSGSYLTGNGLTWSWCTLAGEIIKGSVTFNPPLSPDDWHHYAMCWSQGEFVIYLDGRAVDSRDMTNLFGITLTSQPHAPVYMGGAAIDELRISDVVRYPQDFEPPWRDGARPEHAIAGKPDLQRFEPKLEEPYVPAPTPAPASDDPLRCTLAGLNMAFHRPSGALFSIESSGGHGDGLLLWRGLERERVTDVRASDWQVTEGRVSFTQEFEGLVTVRHELSERSGAIVWDMTLVNQTDEELWLEALLSVPVPPVAVEYFDMSWVHDLRGDPGLPRRRDEWVFSLPFAAVGGEGSVGVGIDPHTDLSALISEHVPDANGCTLRQGTRFVLDPRAEFSLPFVIVPGSGAFGVLDAIDAYHRLFPDLYRRRPEVPIYSYLPVCRYFEWKSLPDLGRLSYNGQQWGHGPGHCKGDEWGTPRLWDMPKDESRPDHAYAARLEKMWGSIEALHEQFLLRSKRSYDCFYTLRRSHYLPNWAMRFVVEDIWPEGMLGGDPLVAGQYYPQMYYANEYRTPLGEHYQWSTRKIMEHIGRYSPGFINDMCQTSAMRFTDEPARENPGRAFSRDRGEYLVGAFGHVDRYRLINSFADERGFHQSIWSDGGIVSYMLLAHSAAAAIESGVPDLQMQGPEVGMLAGRMLLGEKPFALHYSKENEHIGRYYSPDEFTPETLRDYYRYFFGQLLMMALKQGMYLPHDCVAGQQAMVEEQPAVVESIVLGRRIVPAAEVRPKLFVVRAGEGLDSFVAIGNEQPERLATDLVLTDHYFGGSPIFGSSLNDPRLLPHTSANGHTTIADLTVQPRGITGLKCLGLIEGGGEVTVHANLAGDGMAMRALLMVRPTEPARLRLAPIAPFYRASVTVDGAAVPADQPIELPAGSVSHVRAIYTTPALPFGSEEWAQVDLLREGQANFCLIADPASSFDTGTAGMLNQFLEQYDAEDGVLGNLPQAAVGETAPEGFAGWRIVIDSDADVEPSRARLDLPGRAIHIEGRTPGEARRAMVIFLRLLDRKYPHIGRLFPLKYWPKEPLERFHEQTRQFFTDFADQKFLIKPILRREHEALYAGGNVDFAGKYDLRWSPYIFEPTYGDDYVYGFEG